MKLTQEEVNDILQKEIEWHRDHPNDKLHKEFMIGFIAGLKHAKFVLESAEKVVTIGAGVYVAE